MIRSTHGIVRCTSSHSFIPSINGIRISVSRISTSRSRIIGRAISPSGASPTSWNPFSSQGKEFRRFSRMAISSSTRKTFIMVNFLP